MAVVAAPRASARILERLVAAAVAAGAAAGCYAQYPFPVTELKNLDGYEVYKEREEIPVTPVYIGPWPHGGSYGPTPSGSPRIITDKPYRVVSLEGEPMDFSSETPLTLYLRDGRRLETSYRTIAVKDGRFEGVTMEGDRKVSLPLSALSAVSLKRPDSGSTLLVTLAIVGGAVVLLSVAVIAGGS